MSILEMYLCQAPSRYLSDSLFVNVLHRPGDRLGLVLWQLDDRVGDVPVCCIGLLCFLHLCCILRACHCFRLMCENK